MGQNGISALKHWAINSRLTKRLSSGYIVGTDISEAMQACKIAAENNWSATLGPWHYPDDTPGTVLKKYLTALKAICGENLDAYLSIKVWALKYDLPILKELLDFAREFNIRIHFDSLDIESAEPTFALFEKALSTYPNLSCTLPGRWKRSIADAEKVIDLGVPVRVVKGESVDINYRHKNLRDGFSEVIDSLAGRATRVEVATHDKGLAEKSLLRLKERGTPCHLEQLYGIPLRPVSVAQTLGLPIRIYLPYGHSMVGYGLKKIARRPIVLRWMLRDLILGEKFRLPQKKNKG